MQKVNVYIETDFKGFRKMFRWYGYVVEYKRMSGAVETREDFAFMEATGNHVILKALLESLKILNRECHVSVYTDSEYICGMISQNMPKQWKENGWMTAQNKPVANKEEWQQLMKQLERHRVDMVCTKGHSYSEWMKNEIQVRKGDKKKWEQQRLSQ